MKTLKLIKKSLMLTAVVSASLLNSCSSDPNVEVRPALEITAADILVSKLGLDYTGHTPSFGIESNVYWTVSMETNPAPQSGEPEWIVLPRLGGNGSMDMGLTVSPNDSEDVRMATITVTTLYGLTKTINLLQMASDETVAFYTDDFGSTGANNVPAVDFTGWNYSGIGVDSSKGGLPFSYEGTAVVDCSEASSGYDGASGGNHILLSGGESGSEFTLNHIRPLGMVNLDISFGSATTGSAFDSEELILEISSDGTNWYDIPYVRNDNAGWEYTTFSLTLAESYAYIYLRFSTADGEYMIDDVSVTYGEGGEVYALVEILPPIFKGATFPVQWIMNADSQNGLWKETFNLDTYPPYVLSNQQGNTDPNLFGPSSLSYIYGHSLPEGYQYTTALEIGLTGGQTYCNNPWIDDYWLFSVPVASLDAGMIVSVTFATRSSAAGPKYFMLEYMDGDQWLPASEVFKVPENQDYSYTHEMPQAGASRVVAEKFTLANAIIEDTLRIRYRSSSLYRANNVNPMTSPNGSTHRIGFMDNVQPTIDVIDPNSKPETVTFTLTSVSVDEKGVRTIKLPATATPYIFTVKADWEWTLSTTSLGWATVTPAKGDMGAIVSITVQPEIYTGLTSRHGWITLTSGNTTLDIMVIQDRPGTSEGALKDDGKAVGYVYFEDDFSWVTPYDGLDDFVTFNAYAASTTPPPSSGFAVSGRNIYSYVAPGYVAGDLAKAFVEHGYEDINPSSSTIYFNAHYIKFGKTDHQSGFKRTIPGTVQDKGTNITFTFDAAPCPTGSANYDQVSLLVEILDGPGSVGINDGVTTTSDIIEVKQTNKTFPWVLQSKEVVLYGVTSETVIRFGNNTNGTAVGQFRYYLDNLKFTKHSVLP